MPRKDPTERKTYLKRIAYIRAWKARNPERVRAHAEKQNARHRTESFKVTRRAYMAGYRERNFEKIQEFRRKWARAVRRMILDHLGGKCECCGTEEFEFLTLDHRREDAGGKARRNHISDYLEVKRAFEPGGDPEKALLRFSALCLDCNRSKHYGRGVCVHKRSGLPETNSKSTRIRRAIVRRAKAHMGAHCVCCGQTELELLTIDHIAEDGHLEARNKNGTRNAWSYYSEIVRAFKSNDETRIAVLKSRLQLLCGNCNVSKRYGKGVCVHRRNDAMNHAEYPYRRSGELPLCG